MAIAELQQSKFTVFFDGDNKIIWSTNKKEFAPGYFSRYAPEAKTVFIAEDIVNFVAAFAGHWNIEKIYVYDGGMYSKVQNSLKGSNMYDETNNRYYNKNGTTISILITGKDTLFNYISNNETLDSPICVSNFGAKGDGVIDDTLAINLAIQYAINKGLTLHFNGDSTYSISSPIMITPASSVIGNFNIKFNNCKITNRSNIDSTTGKDISPIFTPYTTQWINDGGYTITSAYNTMIYVNITKPYYYGNCVISNIQVEPKIYENDTVNYPGVYTGIYVEGSYNILFENIVINNTVQGVYIDESSSHITMKNMHFSKTYSGALDLTETERDNEAHSDYVCCDNVGINCFGDNCNFSDIIVIDYLIGMKITGNNNRTYGAHIWNYYNKVQYKKSVCFLNEGTNYYDACVADHFYIGWLIKGEDPCYLTNCHIGCRGVIDNGKEIKLESYAFYIADVLEGNYLGENIHAINCYTAGATIYEEEPYLIFCNKKENNINYLGCILNTMEAPIPGMETPESYNAISYENNVPFNQIGTIKSVNKTIENTDEERFNVYRMDDLVFSKTEYDSAGYLDTKVNTNGKMGTIYSQTDTKVVISEENGEKVITISPLNNTSIYSKITLDLKNLGYSNGDEGFIFFDYKTSPENAIEGGVYQEKRFRVSPKTNIKDYFTNEKFSKRVFEECANNEWKEFGLYFKISEESEEIIFLIEHSIVNPTNLINENPINIKHLRIIKMPNREMFPKYYLETEDNFNKRIFKFYANLPYENKISISAYTKDNLAYISHPFKYNITDWQNISCYETTITDEKGDKKEIEVQIPAYQLKYSSLGKACFYGNVISKDSENQRIPFNPCLYIKYNVGENNNMYYYLTNIYPSYHEKYFKSKKDSEVAARQIMLTMRNVTKEKNISYATNNTLLQSIDISEYKNNMFNNILYLPAYLESSWERLSGSENSMEQEPVIITNFITNPDGYYDTIVNTEVATVETKIPLYKDGEVRLILKGQEYSTDLPTFLIQISYSDQVQ